MLKLISVIVPVYNIKDYIRECINSIISQTYSKIEIILVDDGSTDGSEKIVDEFAKKDDRIKCIHKYNGGLSSARNAGLDVCTGDYIVFVDGDDSIRPNALEYLLDLILSYNADIAVIGSYREERLEYNRDVKTNNCPKVFTGIDCANTLTEDKHFFPHAVWGKIYKRDLVSHIRFPIGLNREDTYYSFITSLHSSTIVIDKSSKLYFYRLREGSITTTHTFNTHSFDWFFIWEMCYKNAIAYPEIQKKCARRVVRSYISIISELYSHKCNDSYLQIYEINGIIKYYYPEADLSAFEQLCFNICKISPSLMGIGYLARKQYRKLKVWLRKVRLI